MGSVVGPFAKLGDITIFIGDDGNGGSGIWKTDGTPGGTTLVKPIDAFVNSLTVSSIFTFNNKVYFAGNDGINGAELWQTDGTANGTVMVKDINPAHFFNPGSQPNNFVLYKGAMYFIATDDGNNYGIWKTDGTAGGTVKVFDFGYPTGAQMVVVGNTLYFNIGRGAIWRTDGTAAGTAKIMVDDYSVVEGLHNVNNELVFFTSYTYEHYKIRLYKINPANNTPVLLHDYNGITEIDNITAVGTKLFYSIRARSVDYGNDDQDGLWTSDGTAAGTVAVKSFKWTSHLTGANILNFVAYKDKLYFAGSDNHTLWTSDGTAAGTLQVSTIAMNYDVKPIVYNQKLYFNGNNQLCSFDGSKAIVELQQPAGPDQLFDGGKQLYFINSPAYRANTLWSNAPAAQMEVTINYQTITTGGLSNFASKADSTITVPLTVKNLGNKELEFGEISIAGNSFYVNGSPAKTLLPGKTANMNLLYSPGKEEHVSATLIIKSNDNSGQTNFTANLTGIATGTAKKTNTPANGLFKAIVFKDTIQGFTLSQNTIAENAAINTIIGSFKIANDTAKYVFQLTAGTGDTDNASFKIEGGQLKSTSGFNYKNKSTYTIRVKAAGTTSSAEKIFAVQVTDIQNAAPAPACAPAFQNMVYSLNDAAYIGSRLFSVGTLGKILVSDDDGKNWKIVKSGVLTDFYHIQFTDSKTGYILGGYNTILKTEDGGDSWFPLVPPSNSYPYVSNFYFPSSNTGYAFGGDGVYKTTDGGRSWQKNYSTYNVLNSGWFLDENNGFICGTSQTLIHTTDGGKTWEDITVASLGFNTALSSVVFVNNKTGYISSTVGDVLQTTDGGKTWARISTVSTSGWGNRLNFINETTGYIVGGSMSKTTDGGKTWAVEGSSSTGNGFVAGLAVNKAGNKFCAVGHGTDLGYTSEHGSLILLKKDAGDWETRSSIGNYDYYGGSFFASGTGYVIGEQSFKTTDGGITWKNLNIQHEYYYPSIRSYFIDENTGFYADIHSVYKTTDGAATWTKISTDSTMTIRGIYFYNRQIGFYFNDQNLYKTADGGNSWNKVLQPALNPTVSITFPDQQTGYIVGIGSKFLKTTDGGTSWKDKDIGNDIILTSIGFFDAKTGMGGSIDGSLYRTTDGGETWSPVYTTMRQTTTAFQFISATRAYLLNETGTGAVSEVYESTDAGLTWLLVYQSSSTIWGFRYNDGHLLLTGVRGSIAQYNNLPQLPVNAGYIAGDTTIAAANKLIYSVPAINNAKYRWLVSGAANVEYQNNQVTVAWKKGGQYALQVTPYNDCGVGESRTLNVNVEDMPEPKVTGPDTVLSHAINVVYAVTIHDGNTYGFTAANSSAVKPAANTAAINWGSSGTGTVTVVESNPKLNLKKSASMNVFIKKEEFTLPENNFTVLINAVSCKGSNNGIISVKALASLNYKALVTGPGGFNKSYSFTDTLGIRNLIPGAYNVCLSVTGNADYQRCYNANITEPKDLSLYTAVNPATHILTLNLSGADSFNIELNDKHYQTNSTQIDLPLNTGINKLKVYSEKPCQGIIEKIVNFNKITVYPNPFTNNVNIDLGGSEETNIKVEISNVFGMRVYSKDQTNNDGGKISINTTALAKGVYILRLTLGQTNAVFKIVKQ